MSNQQLQQTADQPDLSSEEIKTFCPSACRTGALAASCLCCHFLQSPPKFTARHFHKIKGFYLEKLKYDFSVFSAI